MHVAELDADARSSGCSPTTIGARWSPRSSSVHGTVDAIVAATRSHADAGGQGAGRLAEAGLVVSRRRRPAGARRGVPAAAREADTRPAPTEFADAPDEARKVMRAFVVDGRITVDSRGRRQAAGDARLAGAGLRAGTPLHRGDGQPDPRQASRRHRGVAPIPGRPRVLDRATGSTGAAGGTVAPVTHYEVLGVDRDASMSQDPGGVPPPGSCPPSRHQRDQVRPSRWRRSTRRGGCWAILYCATPTTARSTCRTSLCANGTSSGPPRRPGRRRSRASRGGSSTGLTAVGIGIVLFGVFTYEPSTRRAARQRAAGRVVRGDRGQRRRNRGQLRHRPRRRGREPDQRG